MKILVIEKYKGTEEEIELYKVYYGKDEGEYYRNDHFTGKKGIRAKCKQLRNGKLYYYGNLCCNGALTKYGVIQETVGGNGYVEGHIPDITIKDLELGIVWTVADYMKKNGLTKFDGGRTTGEKAYRDIYTEDAKIDDVQTVDISVTHLEVSPKEFEKTLDDFKQGIPHKDIGDSSWQIVAQSQDTIECCTLGDGGFGIFRILRKE